MAEHDLLVDPGTMRNLLAGSKTQARHIATSRFAACRAGDQLWLKESCVVGRIPAGETREMATRMRDAEFAVFSDGWRQHRDGTGWSGAPPSGGALEWVPALHMPRWAARATLVVEAVRLDRLDAMTRRDCAAEGLMPLCAGLLWRWPGPARGLWRDPRRAFAALWNASHGPGERWEDDPAVIVLQFRLERRCRASAGPAPHKNEPP